MGQGEKIFSVMTFLDPDCKNDSRAGEP
jgi:hypothetical protein